MTNSSNERTAEKHTATIGCINRFSNQLISRFAALMCLITLTPFMLCNMLFAFFLRRPPLNQVVHADIYGRTLAWQVFSCGWFSNALFLIRIVEGQAAWVGTPVGTRKECAMPHGRCEKPGLVSLYGLRELSGLAVSKLPELMQQQRKLGGFGRITLLVRYAVALTLYAGKPLSAPRTFRLFDIDIDNVSLRQAAKALVLGERSSDRATTACFVNVNSYNLSHKHAELKSCINECDWVFADGSGVRLAAKKVGIRLKDNVNGTDLLPLVCQEAERSRKSIFLLGAAEGVAQAAARNLRLQHTQLKIAGYHHGYFDTDNCEDVIEQINRSGADIVLLGFGSPIQEKFLSKYRYRLDANALVAVGGLFDFFSGRIPRAPLWMRELGLEWVWRLAQEPRKKFHRYVIGNPVFLFRTMFQL